MNKRGLQLSEVGGPGSGMRQQALENQSTTTSLVVLSLEMRRSVTKSTNVVQAMSHVV